jgi:type VI protein secretion system component VasA
MIKTQAQKLARALNCGNNLKFSNGWYESFAKRNGFKEYTIHRESEDAQMEGTEEWIAMIKTKIASYSLDNVYNMDETAYLYNLALDKTIAQRQIEGAKKDKTRLTLVATCNATGSDRV